MKLDQTDKKILYELDKNCRTPVSTIAKKVKCSREVVNYRIQRLQRKGIIDGYYPVINLSTLGYMHIRFMISLKQHDKVTKDKLINYLKNNKYVGWLGEQEGKFDIVCTVLVKDFYVFHEWISDFNEKFSKIVDKRNVSVATVHRAFKNKKIHGFIDDSFAYTVGFKSINKIDGLDFDILKELTLDCRKSILDISYKLKKDVATIKKRIKRLEKEKVIQEYRPRINYGLLGYNYYHIFVTLSDCSIFDKLVSYLNVHPNVLYITVAPGEFDLEFELIVKSHRELKQILTNIKEKFCSIQTRNASLITDVYKTSFIPLSL